MPTQTKLSTKTSALWYYIELLYQANLVPSPTTYCSTQICKYTTQHMQGAYMSAEYECGRLHLYGDPQICVTL